MPKRPRVEIAWPEGAPPPPELPEATLRAQGEVFLESLGLTGGAVTVMLAGDAELRALNAQFRGLDRPTDVLSFSYGSAGQAPSAGAIPLESDSIAPAPDKSPPDVSSPGTVNAPDEAVIGEIAISLDRARAQATENGWDLATEVTRLLAHACAHLAGYDHQTPPEDAEMRRVEIEMLGKIGLESIYL